MTNMIMKIDTPRSYENEDQQNIAKMKKIKRMKMVKTMEEMMKIKKL